MKVLITGAGSLLGQEVFNSLRHTRLFSDWSMKSDNYNLIEWGDPALNAGNFLNISADAAKNIFTRISEQADSSF